MRHLQEAEQLRRNDEQWAAFESTGNCIVLAGPGSGKTKVLSLKMARVLAEDVRHPSGIACVTYSNECVRELRRRLDELGTEESETVFVGTLHGFCIRHVLGPFAHLTSAAVPSPIKVASEKVALDILGEAARSIGQCGNPEYMKKDIGALRRVALDRRSSQGWCPGEPVTDLCIEYERQLLQKGYIDFDGTIFAALGLIEQHEFVCQCLAARFPVLFIDEYQDLGLALHRMVLRLVYHAGVRLFAVGDPDQSIYGFTGARPELLRELALDRRNETVSLRLNYRSGRTIVAASKAVLGEDRAYTANADAEGTIDFHECGAGVEQQVHHLVDTVLPDLFSRYEPGEVVVLHFSWREGDQIEQALVGAGLEYVRLGGSAAYPRTPITRLLEEFAIWTAGGWKSGAPRLSRLMTRWLSLLGARDPKDTREQRLRVAQFLFDYRECGADLLGAWLEELRQRLVLAPGVLPRLADNGHAEAFNALLNVTQAGQPLEAFTVANFGRQTGSPDQVNVLTLHSSKGREFDAVVIVGADEGRLPHYRSIGNAEKVQEVRRLFYVGLSRARHEVRLMHSPKRSGDRCHQGPSRFLVEVRNALSGPLRSASAGNVVPQAVLEGFVQEATGEADVAPEEWDLSDDEDDRTICESCDPGSERPPALVNYRTPLETPGTPSEVDIGHCDWCSGISIRCRECGVVHALMEGDYDEPVECEGACGMRFIVRSADPHDGGWESVVVLASAPTDASEPR